MKNIKALFLNDYIILILIVLNAVLIFIQEFDTSVTSLVYLVPVSPYFF